LAMVRAPQDEMLTAGTGSVVSLSFDKTKFCFVLSFMKLFGMASSSSEERSAASVGYSSAVAAILMLATVIGLAGCDKKSEATEADVRPVRTFTVEPSDGTEVIAQTGEIRARNESDLGFRIVGKIIERPVDIGSTVKRGNVLARLDPQPVQQDLEFAKATVASAQATLVRDTATEARQSELLKKGYTPQASYDVALAALKVAQSQLNTATARLRQAEDNLGYAELRADADGVITAVSADIGRVVTSGQAVVRLAQLGEREAVFNISEAILDQAPVNPPVTVKLTGDPSVFTVGRVRYVSPQADPTTRTYEVRVSLPDAPARMRLGATVTGSMSINHPGIIEVPASALFAKEGRSAVWVVDPKSATVVLKPVAVERYTDDRIILSGGLENGELVVTAGVQKLVPGQKVRSLVAVGK
jgi:membrane fusion protein, multidrug efflux system